MSEPWVTSSSLQPGGRFTSGTPRSRPGRGASPDGGSGGGGWAQGPRGRQRAALGAGGLVRGGGHPGLGSVALRPPTHCPEFQNTAPSRSPQSCSASHAEGQSDGQRVLFAPWAQAGNATFHANLRAPNHGRPPAPLPDPPECCGDGVSPRHPVKDGIARALRAS